MMRLKDYSIIGLLFLSVFAFAQHQLGVTVKEIDSNTPLAGVELYLSQNVGKTNPNGHYVFTHIASGKYTLHAYAEGYQLFEQPITVKQDFDVELFLEPVIALNEIQVKAQEKKVFDLRRLNDVEGTMILAGKKNEVVLVDQLTANLATNNARQIYGQVVGLNIFEYNDGGLQLGIGSRGLDPNRTANFNTRQNGYDISADVLGYPESYYTPPAEALSEVQIIRGAASLQYGTQFGGLINFKFKKPKKNDVFEFETRNTLGSYNLFTTFNSISGTAGKVGYYAFFNYKRGNSFRSNSEFEAYNYYGHVDYQIFQRTILSAEFTHFGYLAQQPGGLTDDQFYTDPSFSNRERNWFSVDWNLFNLKLDHTFVNEAKFSTQFFGLQSKRKALGFRDNRVSAVDNVGEPRDLLVGEFDNWGVESRYLQDFELNNQSHVFLIGAKYYHAANSQQQGPGSRDADADFEFDFENTPDYRYQSYFDYPNRNIALFGESIYKLNEQWSITPGFRFEWIKTSADGVYKHIETNLAGDVINETIYEEEITKDRTLFLYGLGLSYKNSKALEFYGNFSKNYRSVTFSDIQVVSPSFFVADDIKDETGFTLDIGFRGRYSNLVNFDANGFMLLYDNRIGEYYSGDVDKRGRDNIGKAITYGVESFIDVNLARLFNFASNNYQAHYFLNTTFTNSQYYESELGIDIQGNKVEFVPDINLRTGFSFGYKNWSNSLLWTYLSEQYTDATNAKSSKIDKIGGIIGQIPSYHILDFSTSYRYKRYTLEAGINNVLDRSYFVRRASGYPGPGIIPSNPRTYYMTFGIKL